MKKLASLLTDLSPPMLFDFNICTYRCFHCAFCVETLLAIHFQGAAILQHRSILFAPLNFRTRLFYLAIAFAVLVCAPLCFLIFARFVRRIVFDTTRSSFSFLPRSSVLVVHFNLGSEAIRRLNVSFCHAASLLYLFLLTGLNFEYFIAVPCSSICWNSTSICGNSTDGKGPSLESLGQPKHVSLTL